LYPPPVDIDRNIFNSVYLEPFPIIYRDVDTADSPTPSADMPNPSPDSLDQHAPALYRFLARRLRAGADIDDVVQYIYLRFLQSPHRDLVQNLEGYLIRIAANVVNEFALRYRREIVTFNSETLNATVQRQSELELWHDDVSDPIASEQQIRHVLQQVPPACRAVLALWLWEDLTYEQIAARLGLSVTSVKKYVNRGIAYCRQADWSGEAGSRTEPK
jgi:RNA polymerase sigma factor (sigma-70 family)